MTEQLFNEITAWQDKQFPTSTAASKSKHLKEEITELDAALKDGTPQHKIAFEIADCLFLITGIAHKQGMTYQDVCNALEVKFKINTTRQWGAPDADGMSKHILSKQEAINLMKKGLHLTHRYFADDEWVTQKGNIIIMEKGQEIFADIFWKDRQGEAWETDWEIKSKCL